MAPASSPFLPLFVLLLASTMCSQTEDSAEFHDHQPIYPVNYDEQTQLPTTQDSRYLKGDPVYLEKGQVQHSSPLVPECRLQDSVSCFKFTVLSNVARLLSQSFIPLTEGIAFVKESSSNSIEEKLDQLSIEKTSSSRNIEHFTTTLWNSLTNFIQTHALKVLIPETPISSPFIATGRMNNDGNLEFGVEVPEEAGRGEGGGFGGLGGKGGGGFGGGKGGKKGYGGLMIAMMTKAGTVAAMKMGAMAFIAKKALILSAVALVLSAIVAVKKLSAKDDDYTVVSYGGGGGGGYHRSFKDKDNYWEGDDLAYRGHFEYDREPGITGGDRRMTMQDDAMSQAAYRN